MTSESLQDGDKMSTLRGFKHLAVVTLITVPQPFVFLMSKKNRKNSSHSGIDFIQEWLEFLFK